MEPLIKVRQRFAWFAWAVLAFNFPVILWGAYVRVSYSGDGCGAHWPFCNAQALPQHMSKPTLIEFTHRMMTSVDLILIVALVVAAFMVFPKRAAVRRYAAASLVFLLIEALLGAGLVIFRMVAHDQSSGRAWYLSAHLTNTMLMLAAITLTAWFATVGRNPVNLLQARRSLLWSAVVTVLVSITGAVTALGDTLFPAHSLLAGVHQDLAANSPLLVRLRVAHPAIAMLGTALVVWAALEFWRSSSAARARRAALRLVYVYLIQLLIGAVNLTFLAPLPMQLIHLTTADLVWVAMVLAIAESALLPTDFSFKVALGSEATASKSA